MKYGLFSIAASVLLVVAGPLLAADDVETRIRRTLARIESEGKPELVNISPEDGELLRALTVQHNARNVIVIAGPVGYSTLWFALGVHETGGKITYLQENAERVAEARKVFAEAGVEDIVHVIQGNPHDNYAYVARPADLVFLDADKGGNQDYLHKILPLLPPGGLMIAHETISEPMLVKNYLDGLSYIRKLESITLDADGKGMTITVVKKKASSLSGRVPYGADIFSGPKPRIVDRKPDNAILGYINHIPPETPEERALRHQRVMERRNRDLPILVHRGDDKAAPENTLEAYTASIDKGADGVEIDIHRSRDGVLYMMHDGHTGRVANKDIDGSEST